MENENIDYLEAAKEQLTKADQSTLEAEFFLDDEQPKRAVAKATLAAYHNEQARTLALIAIADELRKMNVNLGALGPQL